MAEYYGIQRSSEHLEHYGIKGMKWGVRKAREHGNNFSLAYHHARAKLKLAKLKLNSNWMIHDVKSRAWGILADNKIKPVRMVGHLVGAKTRQKIHDWKTTYDGDVYTDRKRDKFQAAYDEAFKGTKYDPMLKAKRKLDAEAESRRLEKQAMKKNINDMQRKRKHIAYEKGANGSRALYIDISPSSFKNAKKVKRKRR